MNKLQALWRVLVGDASVAGPLPVRSRAEGHGAGGADAPEETEDRRRILEAAVEAASDSIMVTDVEGVIRYVNPAFSRITGWDRTEAVGRNPRILMSGRQDEAFYQRMWDTLEAGRTFRGRFVNRRANGKEYTQEATITPIFGDDGAVEHYVSVARDVTEKELLENQLVLAARSHAMGQVVDGVSHDFKNLLGIVRAQVDLAEAACEEGRLPREELDEIGRAAERGADLVRKLFTLGRTEAVGRTSVSLTEIVAQMRPALRAVLPGSVTFDVQTPAGDAMVVWADRGSIEQILVNLVVNSRDAVAPGGRVSVDLARVKGPEPDSEAVVLGEWEGSPEGAIRLRVRDDGEGMDAATLEHAFKPFFTTKPRDHGTGLGMPMVARMARLNGGTLAVSSAPGAGTTVSLFLSASSDEASTERAGGGGVETLPRGHGERVLVADDEAALLRAQVRVLERLGYETLAARNGDEAVRILEEQGSSIHLVMTDLVMPGRGGKDVFDEMGVLGLQHIPIVFMSGYHISQTERQLPAGGDSHFLEKPWTIGQLARKVADVLQEAPAGVP